MIFIKRVNDFLAIQGTRLLGTMWCTYAFIALCLSPLLAPSERDTLLYVSNCFQLVFLPILLVGQNLLDKNARAQAQQDHEAILEELNILKKLYVIETGKNGEN
jgi:hypothetical protein